MHWEGDQLCQMHVSYFSEFDRWTNSPGMYQDGTADFARPVTSRCLDCHTTWFGHQPESINRFDRQGAILGVTCVRCHGPAGEHVQFHRLQPDESTPHFIVNPVQLERGQLHQVCAQCHSGGGELRRPAFSYVPGEPLDNYLDLDLSANSEQNDDPHSANQLGRLMRSACFQGSEELSCVTCHDPHRHERGNTALFSSRCIQCHKSEQCGVHPRFGSAIGSRCIECHMPSRRDAEVSAASGSKNLLPLLRDHLIGIWPDVSVRVERSMTTPDNGGRSATSGKVMTLLAVRRLFLLTIPPALACGIVSGCGDNASSTSPGDSHSSPIASLSSPVDQVDPQVSSAPESCPIHFSSVDSSAGIDFIHKSGDSEVKPFPAANGSGVGVVDFDHDGFCDLYFATGNTISEQATIDEKSVNCLYRNIGGLRFSDCTDETGLGHDGFFRRRRHRRLQQ